MALVFDAVYNSEGVMRGVRESQRAFAELRSSAENEGRKIDAAFNKQIYEGSQSVNALTGKIIDQKKTVRSLTKDIDTLTESYKKVSPDSVKGKDLFASLTNAKSMLKNKKEELLELQTQQAQVRLSVRMLKEEYSLYQKEGQNVVESNNDMALSFKKTLAAIGGTAMIKKFVSDVVRVRGEFQQLDVAFTTLLQSKDKSNALMQQMVQTAAKTPFNLTELATGAKQLVAYGFASEGVNDTLIRLGNIAAGLGLPLERLTYLYGTTMTQGRLYARDLMQFTTSGIPMLQGLADMYGVSTDKVNEMVTAGKIGFPEVQKVIENMTNEGGKFFNLMEEQSKTITGKISNLGDAWDEMLNKIGQSQEGVINGSIDGLKYLVEHYETVGKILTGLIGVYGTYRTAAMLVTAVHSLQTAGISALTTKEAIHYAWLVATKKAQLALNATMLTNPYVLLATAVVGTVAAIWALHDGTTAAEKAQESYNKKVEGAAQKAQDHKHKLEGLISELQNEVTAETRKMEILDEIKEGYPSLFQKFIDEKGHIKDLTEGWKAYNEEASKNKAIQDKSNVSGAKTNLQEYLKSASIVV